MEASRILLEFSPPSFLVSVSGECFILCLYKKKATTENITNNENATETAIATFLAGFVGFVAVGFAILAFEPDGDGRFWLFATGGGGGPVGSSLKNGMSGEGGVLSGGGGGGENSGGGAEVAGINNGWCRILLSASVVVRENENDDNNMIKKKVKCFMVKFSLIL